MAGYLASQIFQDDFISTSQDHLHSRLISTHRLIQRPVHQSFGLAKCTVGLVGLAKKWCIC